MASSATASSIVLESLLARPPTPPRDTQPEILLSRRPVPPRSPFDPRLQLSTPPNPSSPLSNGATNSLSASKRMRKKVEWSAHTEYKDPPQYLEVSKPYRASPLSASRSASKPIKGILKPSSSPNPLASSLHGGLDGLSDQTNIAEMLDSTIKQLAGSDRDSRLDAYMMLARALKASNNLPDRVALQDKMSLFMQFIQRDVKAKTETGTSDASLINHALNLLTTFLHFQAIASTLTSDFGVFIIDHCVRSFDDPSVPKDLVRHLMQVVAFQSFSPKVMTLDRVGRLVNSLHKIEDRLTGKSIIMGRIQIYKRLIGRSRNHMAIHTDWMIDMFTDMLSSIRDIRAQAISLATDAGFSLRYEKQILRKATEIFQATGDGDQTYIEFYMKKLEDMIKDKQCPSVVPQIWGAVTLFLRCPLDRWQYFNNWLKLAQSAFNTTDWETKYEANYAWNRYVHLSLMDTKVVPKGLSLMIQPLLSQLRRKVNTEEGMKLRRIVFGGLCNLYYYVFRPGPDSALIDAFWDIALHPVMTQLINPDGKPEPHSDSLIQASRILAGLLDVSTPRSWREDRVRDTPLVPPEELPSIDAKWTRRNCEKVFKLVGPILEKKFTDLANKESLTYRLWQALTASIAAASAKDIKVSDDTAKFFACTFGLLCRVWSKGSLEDDGSLNPKFLPSIKNYLHLLIKSLGLLPFTEKKLSMSINNTFEPVATPSHRPDRVDNSRGIVQAPVYHLFLMLCSIPPGAADDETLCEFFQSVFEPFFSEKGNKMRVELTREMLRLLPRDSLCPYGPWVLTANNMRATLENMGSSSSPPSSEKLLGPEYREVVSLLERGLLSHPNLPSEYWTSLFNLLSEQIVQQCGDAGRALGLVEPVSKILLENFFNGTAKSNSLALKVTVMLFNIAKLPRDRQAVEAARRRLWGAPPTNSRASSFDPFDNLYKLQEQSMKYLYNSTNSNDEADIASYFEAITRFLVACFSETGIRTLSKLQEGFCPWIQDEKARVTLSDESPVPIAVRDLWNVVCRQLVSLGRLENKDLTLIEAVITAAFKSKHRYIVNKMAETWNDIYKNEDSLDCSDSLKAIITALRPMVDVSFPGIENSSGEFGAQAQSFIELQNDISFIALSSAKSSRNEIDHPSPPAPSLPKIAAKGPMTRRRHRDATPDTKKVKVNKRTSTPRLRHDNSQIHFEPIASSSPVPGESQHLTERQKEVRERQRENAGIYVHVRSSPRTRSMAALEEKAMEPSESIGTRHKQSTPERPASYEEFISSTPTPRRGQALQIDEYAEPPSSPPEPRPNPLLNEIQTRSRGKSSLESWEFSSPPGTPPIPRQQRVAKRFPRATPSGRATRRSRRSRAKSKSPTELDIVPSSIVEEQVDTLAPAEQETEQEAEKPKEMVQEPPSTPRRDTSPDNKVQDTPKSADDEYVDARSSPEEPTQESRVEESESSDCVMRDSSFELSEIDESGMMKLVVELESKSCNPPLLNDLPQKEGCITVHTDESSPPKEREKVEKRAASPVIPSTPAQIESELLQSQSQSQGKKRKRASMVPERRSKRRRSGVDTTLEKDQDAENQPNQTHIEETESPGPTTRRSSRRNAGLKGKKQREKETKSLKPTPPKETKASDSAEVRDGGDTDEELMSQLVTESKAASHSQLLEDVDPEAGPSASVDSIDLEVAEQEPPVQQPQENAETPRLGLTGSEEARGGMLMDIFRGGLNELRGAALSRDQVYQLEDILMDMKRELFAAERRGRQ